MKYRVGDIIRWDSLPVEVRIYDIIKENYHFIYLKNYKKYLEGECNQWSAEGMDEFTHLLKRPFDCSKFWKEINL